MVAPRNRPTKLQQATLDDQILDVIGEDHPQSVRHCFYRLTDPRLAEPVPKTEHGYRRVQRRCLALRRNGRIPYGWISDATRRGYHVSTFDGPGDFIARFAGLYRAELWTEDLPHVEVWVESRSLAGVLVRTCEDLAVSLYPAGGFTSATLAYEAALEIDREERDRAVVLYVGDFDPAGVLIDQSIEAELRSHLATPLEFHRLAVNEHQIAELDLPAKPRKVCKVCRGDGCAKCGGTGYGDRRRLDIAETVEAEAIPAAVMRRMVRETVEAYLPDGALHAAKVAEESERDGLRALGKDIGELGMNAFL